MSLVDRIAAVCAALKAHDIPYALGGALALAYATEEPRATRDIDVNVFLGSESAREVVEALPDGVAFSDEDMAEIERNGQVRLWWDDTPIDLFFAEASFHHEANGRCRTVPFAGHHVRVLSAEDLAVFKAMFNRPKDWVDIATMAEAHALNADVAADRLAALLGDDDRVDRLRELRSLT
jgi:hypothetical protein